MSGQIYDLMVDPEFEAYLPIQSEEQDAQLEEALRLTSGPISPIVDWKGRNIIVDGHRRYKICEKNGWLFKRIQLEFVNRADALAWRNRIQATRRNLTDLELSSVVARIDARGSCPV